MNVATPSFSVIVPAYQAEKTLGPALEAIRRSDHSRFELIVVDDGSSDGTAAIAKKFADQVVRHPLRQGRSHARNAGAILARGETLIFIDADVVVKPESFGLITRYFEAHPEVEALTGLLGKEHPHPDFFSQYKNLYMHFIFSALPDRVSFLYGSIHAIRRQSWEPHGGDVALADDTALGQKLCATGKPIAFLKNLEVLHLKKLNVLSFLKNDFQIPFDWGQIFIRYRGWRELGKNGAGFLHAPTWQLAAVALAPLLAALLMLNLATGEFYFATLILAATWFFLNARLLLFFARERGSLFAIAALPVTFLDQLVMATGIICGLLYSLSKKFRGDFR